MNVHNLFPNLIADPINKFPYEIVEEVDLVKVDRMVMLTINEVAGQWEINIHSARLTNPEILMALELMKRDILERMTNYA